MKHNWMKKSLVVSVILLFIGVAVAPSINQSIVTASQDDDLVEVTTQACGIQGYGDTTVKLTRQQYQDLEQYLVEFRARLNQTTTREEAIPIFKEAVVELDKYGLLPKGMSIEQAQKLVANGYEHQRNLQLIEKIYDKNPLPRSDVDNLFCLVAGKTNSNFILGPIKGGCFFTILLMAYIVWYIAGIIESLGLEKLLEIVEGLYDVIEAFYLPVRGIPFEIGGFVTFGAVWYRWEEPTQYTASNGWIYSLGLRGIQSIDGSFYGTIREMLFGFYVGLSGFTGIVLRPWGTWDLIFFGSAFRVGVSTNHLP